MNKVLYSLKALIECMNRIPSTLKNKAYLRGAPSAIGRQKCYLDSRARMLYTSYSP
jgi:hypothetical protein